MLKEQIVNYLQKELLAKEAGLIGYKAAMAKVARLKQDLASAEAELAVFGDKTKELEEATELTAFVAGLKNTSFVDLAEVAAVAESMPVENGKVAADATPIKTVIGSDKKTAALNLFAKLKEAKAVDSSTLKL